jgi:antitoxin VapB
MGILIKDPETDRLVRELAARTGESITESVRKAVWERLQRIPTNEDEMAARNRKLADLRAYFDSLPRINEHLTNDEVIGYNEQGHFD